MGIDNDAILMFGFFVDRNLTLEWLGEQAPTEDEAGEDPDEGMLLERADFIKFPLPPDRYMFGVGTASPYYDAYREDQTYFFGIVFNRIEAKEVRLILP